MRITTRRERRAEREAKSDQRGKDKGRSTARAERRGTERGGSGDEDRAPLRAVYISAYIEHKKGQTMTPDQACRASRSHGLLSPAISIPGSAALAGALYAGMEASRLHAYQRSPDTVLLSLRRRLCPPTQGNLWQVIESVQRAMSKCFCERQGGEDGHYLRSLGDRRAFSTYISEAGA